MAITQQICHVSLFVSQENHAVLADPGCTTHAPSRVKRYIVDINTHQGQI